MTQTPLARLAGPIALLAGLLICTAQVDMFATLDIDDRAAALADPLFVASMATYFVALGVALLALVATYEVQAHRAGTFGLVACVAAFAGTVFLAGIIGSTPSPARGLPRRLRGSSPRRSIIRSSPPPPSPATRSSPSAGSCTASPPRAQASIPPRPRSASSWAGRSASWRSALLWGYRWASRSAYWAPGSRGGFRGLSASRKWQRPDRSGPMDACASSAWSCGLALSRCGACPDGPCPAAAQAEQGAPLRRHTGGDWRRRCPHPSR
jgi:hypothetical protein